jgi:hypothetical protein
MNKNANYCVVDNQKINKAKADTQEKRKSPEGVKGKNNYRDIEINTYKP